MVGNHNMNGRFPIPGFAGLVICPIIMIVRVRVLLSVSGPLSRRNSWGLGSPFSNWLSRCRGYRCSSDPSQQMVVYQFLLFLKFRSIWCAVESAIVVRMTELSSSGGNHNVNGRFFILGFPGIVICPSIMII